MKMTPVDGRREEGRAEPFIQVSLPHASWQGLELLLTFVFSISTNKPMH